MGQRCFLEMPQMSQGLICEKLRTNQIYTIYYSYLYTIPCRLILIHRPICQSYRPRRVWTTRLFNWSQTSKIFARKNLSVAQFRILRGLFFLASDWFHLCVKIIAVVHPTYGKFCTNEFFKHAYEIFKSRPHKRLFDADKWTLLGHCTRRPRTITVPKVAQVIKTGEEEKNDFAG
jgi:hypothetical protein